LQAIGIVLFSLVAVVTSGFLARLSRLPLPLVQIALGALVWYAGLGSVALEPDVFFLLLLPPLLFLDGWRIPKDDLLRDASTILKLAMGLVVFTVVGAGLFVHWLIPAMPLAVAFALAAVISPTDPIAVEAIAARTPIPVRMMRVLQGEALLNDASGLVCLRFAVAAALTGSFSLTSAIGHFAWAALGGVAIGIGLTWALTRLVAAAVARLGEDGSAQIIVTLLIPFGVYLIAERAGCSGILAAVAAGMTMSFTRLSYWRAETRLRRTAVWDTVQFAANGSIFVLLGEQIPALVADAADTVRITGHANPWWLAVYILLVVLVLATLRFAWVWVSLKMGQRGSRRSGAALPFTQSWRMVLATSVAGVRGAVTLAGVMTLPLLLEDGSPFPARELAIVIAAGVIVVSMVAATIALPPLLGGLAAPVNVRHRREDRARIAAAEAAIRAIEANRSAAGRDEVDLRGAASTRLVARYRARIASLSSGDEAWATRDTEADIEHEVGLVGLRAERNEIEKIWRHHGMPEARARAIVRELDLQEARHIGFDRTRDTGH
jgi:CPA1 family monovalent cation:H+ antiporter